MVSSDQPETVNAESRLSGAWRGRKKLGSSREPGLPPAADVSAANASDLFVNCNDQSQNSIAAANIPRCIVGANYVCKSNLVGKYGGKCRWCPRGHRCLARSRTYTQMARSNPSIAESCSSSPNRERFRDRYLDPLNSGMLTLSTPSDV